MLYFKFFKFIAVFFSPLQCKLHEYKEFIFFFFVSSGLRKFLLAYNSYLLNYFAFPFVSMDSSRVTFMFLIVPSF